MLIKKERPVRSGLLSGGMVALVIGTAVVIVNCVDILLSQRLSYSKFAWSGLHGVAEALVRYALFSVPLSQPPAWPTYLSFSLESLVLTVGAYILMGQRFPTGAARRKYVLGFLLGVLVASLGVAQVAGGLVFVVAVLKFGFV